MINDFFFLDLFLTDEQVKFLCLRDIEKLMHLKGRSLRDYPSFPLPEDVSMDFEQNQLISDEMSYNIDELKEERDKLIGMLNSQQRVAYETIMNSIDSESGRVFFLYGYGGSGKTFVWSTLSAAVRSRGQIVLNVASSGIASLLLPGGRTAHSRFAIPLNLTEDSTCNIKQNSALAELIVKSTLIIWDEAPMMHR